MPSSAGRDGALNFIALNGVSLPMKAPDLIKTLIAS
jgi:hypothetical protein